MDYMVNGILIEHEEKTDHDERLQAYANAVKKAKEKEEKDA